MPAANSIAPEASDVAELRELLAGRDAVIAAQSDELSELREMVSLLKAQVEVQQEQLKQDSQNSHKPPSSDGPGATFRRKSPKKSKAKDKKRRKRGGQKGHRGAHRSLVSPDKVDEFVHLFPEACEGCAASLPETRDSDPRRYQLFEWRIGGVHVTEFQRH